MYTAWLSGSPADRIVIRPVPYERVIFRTALTGGDPSQLRVEGHDLEFWDLEFENTNPDRTVARPHAIYNKNSHNRYVRLIIHDVGIGIYNEPTAQTSISAAVSFTIMVSRMGRLITDTSMHSISKATLVAFVSTTTSLTTDMGTASTRIQMSSVSM